MLGLSPDALKRELRIIRPTLPLWLGTLALTGLTVGDATVDLRYQRTEGVTLVAVLRRKGALSVRIEH